MKNLEAYMKNLYVTLEGIDEELKDKLSNIDGQLIGECCGACCTGCDDGCCCKDNCPCEPNCNTPVTPALPTPNQFGRFNSEYEITHELDSQVKVNTLYDIFAQFARFTFTPDLKKLNITPLYFGHKECSGLEKSINRENCDMPTSESDPENVEQFYDVPTAQNKKIYKAVTDIVSTFDLQCPVVQTKINGEVQVYAIKRSGTNGKENSIKTSLEEVAKILSKLESRSDVQWSQVLDVAIDNIDDMYTFVITFVFNLEKVRETAKTEKLTA